MTSQGYDLVVVQLTTMPNKNIILCNAVNNNRKTCKSNFHNNKNNSCKRKKKIF